MAARFVVLITPEKRVEKLGERAPIPVEVVPFAAPLVEREMNALAIRPELRQRDGALYHTDNGNLIIDAHITPTSTAQQLDEALRAIPGVVDTGLFLNMADEVLIGSDAGVEQMLR